MTYPLVSLGSVAPLLALNIYQENQTRNHNLLHIGITDRYILNIQTLHTQMYKLNAKNGLIDIICVVLMLGSHPSPFVNV
jgi:hypothetical protein